jgi:hypothetical protein
VERACAREVAGVPFYRWSSALVRRPGAPRAALTAGGGLPAGSAAARTARVLVRHGAGADLEAPRCVRGLGAGDLGRARASGRYPWGRGPVVRRVRRGASARVPVSNDADYPCLTEYISKFLN